MQNWTWLTELTLSDRPVFSWMGAGIDVLITLLVFYVEKNHPNKNNYYYL